MKLIYNFLLGIESLLLLLGISVPLARIQEFWIFTSQFSIVSIISTLWESREYALSLTIVTFGVIFPAAKVVSKIFRFREFERIGLDRFALVDIFLLAFLVFSAKLSSFFDVALLAGFYFLLGFIIIGAITSVLQKRL
ncbi:MAG: paraquat-inducible protein A [Pseudomonadota bacterium]|nr:paraquat-inducible protein A [Pseudomonadota bacterium]